MTRQRSPHHSRSSRPRPRTLAPLGAFAAFAAAAVTLAACGSSSPAAARSTQPAASSSAPSTVARMTTPTTMAGSCTGVAGAHHVRVVVESSVSSVVARCVGFSTPTIAATKLLAAAHVSLGTQKYSFGLAICQVDGVPAHYSQCLPSGKPYWAMFVSRDGKAWTSAASGISDTSLRPGDSLGLRYDPPTGKAAPPPAPTPA